MKVLAFLGGALAGAAAALLLAPEKGEVMRRKLRHMVNHHVDEMEDMAQDLRRKANKAGRETIEEVAKTAHM